MPEKGGPHVDTLELGAEYFSECGYCTAECLQPILVWVESSLCELLDAHKARKATIRVSVKVQD